MRAVYAADADVVKRASPTCFPTDRGRCIGIMTTTVSCGMLPRGTG
jgi:hypothetical protein